MRFSKRLQRDILPPDKGKSSVVKLIGGRAASAVMGLFMLGVGSSAASAQGSAATYPTYNVSSAVKSLDVDSAAKPLGTTVASIASTLARPAVAATTVVTNGLGNVFQAQPAQSVTLKLDTSIATQAAWLYRGGWPLYALVDKFATNAPLDEQTNCLATAVYFEARGESLEGQLAVARVVMNRAASGRYPASWCEVVKQPAQFSFVRNGQFPYADTASDAWRKAEAIAELASANIVPSVGTDVLWYHADYVAPSWGRRLSRADKIGAHIFYRA
jgi:spore germination cell wall hydrolase CwlJ-like protein